MRKVKELFRLKYESKLSNRKISKSLKISPSTISEYLSRQSEKNILWEKLKDLNDEKIHQLLFGPEKKSKKKASTKYLPDWKIVFEELKSKGVTIQLLWREYIDEYPDGYRYSQFCDLYKKWKKKLNASMHQNHKGGEKLFIDYVGVTVPIADHLGQIRKANIFVIVFGASNYFYLEAHFGESKKNWINAHIRAFEYFGGVSQILVPDNLKAGVTSPCYYEPDINPTYHELARHYNVAVIPARVRKPKDKAKVEVCVQVVEQSILAVLRNRSFFSLYQLNKELKKFAKEINNREMKHIGKSRTELFESVDKPFLKPLPQIAFEYAEWKKAKVGIDYHVKFDFNFYSVPYKYIHVNTDIKATQGVVEIYHRGNVIASHQRSIEKNQYLTTDEHMPVNHKQMQEWSPQRIRNWAEKTGKHTGLLIESILKSRKHPEQSYRKCLGIINLGKKFGEQRLDLACKLALHYEIQSYRKINNILKKGLENEKLINEVENKTVSCDHENIRGEAYYLLESQNA